MDFDLTDEQRQIQDSVAKLLRDVSSDAKVLAFVNSGAPRARDVAAGLAGLGLAAILVPEGQGGLGMDLLTLAVVAEQLGRFATPSTLPQDALAAWILAVAGNERQRAQWLDDLVSGAKSAAFALEEEGDRWEPDAWTLTAGRARGQKISVAGGVTADVFIVGLEGGKLGLVAREAPAVTVTPVSSLDATRPLATVAFDNAEIEPLEGAPDLAARVRDALLVLTAADAYGAAAKGLDMSVEYAKVRHQFGRPIGQFQALKHQLASSAFAIEPCRALYWYAAHAWDALPDEASRSAAIAKAHITDVAVTAGRAAVDAHGGIGFTWEYPLHLYLKRAMHDRAAYGLPALHRERAALLAGW